MKIPNATIPISDQNGVIGTPWYRFFDSLDPSGLDLIDINLGASPFSYIAQNSGALIINGGTISSLVLTRKGKSVTLPSLTSIPMGTNDTIVITYSGTPILTFIPGG